MTGCQEDDLKAQIVALVMLGKQVIVIDPKGDYKYICDRLNGKYISADDSKIDLVSEPNNLIVVGSISRTM